MLLEITELLAQPQTDVGPIHWRVGHEKSFEAAVHFLAGLLDGVVVAVDNAYIIARRGGANNSGARVFLVRVIP